MDAAVLYVSRIARLVNGIMKNGNVVYGELIECTYTISRIYACQQYTESDTKNLLLRPGGS